MYNAVRSIYTHPESCIRINDMFSNYFPVRNGVRQGDNISPTLIFLYINELANEIKSMNVGISVGNIKLNILLYADHMVLVANSEGVAAYVR
jgi:hypothetical protein